MHPLPNDHAPAKHPIWRERQAWIVSACCIIGAIRVFFFSAAFPLFNNIDEEQHFDLIVKYANGQVPRGIERFSADSAAMMALYGTYEYLNKPSDFPSGRIPGPVWHLPPGERNEIVADDVKFWLGQYNHESTQPPLYYALAGAWYDMGQAVGVSGGWLLYWTRFLNVLIYAGLIWMGYRFARDLVPENALVYLGTPLLLAFFPQDTFYGLNNDSLAALLATLAYLLLIRWLGADRIGLGLSLFTGAAVAGAVLAKLSNAPVLVALGIVVVVRSSFDRKSIFLMAAVVAAAVIPIGAWMIRNHWLMGDFTGTAAKSRLLGWTPAPFLDALQHPILTPSGLANFWGGLMASIWRGEFVWHSQRLTYRAADVFLVVSSTLFLLAFAVGRFRSRRKLVVICTAIVLLHALFLAYLSTAFDFGACLYPSRQWPYFTSGRLMLGAVVPFLVMYLLGLETLLSALRLGAIRWWVVICITLAIALMELALSTPAFASRFNFFHLGASPEGLGQSL